jgi:hypothetical protein
MCGEAGQCIAMPPARALDPAEDVELVLRVSDPEAGRQIDVRPELTQERGAKGVDRASLDAIAACPEPVLEPLRDLPRRLVGERERANAVRPMRSVRQ